MSPTFIRMVAAATALTATTMVLIPGAAHAASDNPNCKLIAGPAGEAVDLVSGTGRVQIRRGCGTQNLRVTVERSRFYGWESVAKVDMPQDNKDYRVSYDCTGTGTHDFRITVMPVGYAQFAVSSPALRGVVCSS